MLENERQELYGRARTFAEQQLAGWIDRHPDVFPAHARDGSWSEGHESGLHGSEQYLVGLMWQLNRLTSQASWQERAQHYGQLLEERRSVNPSSPPGHPGCLHSHLPWYQLTCDRQRRGVLFQAATELAERFHHRGRFLASPQSSDLLSIETMLEVPVMFYTANETLDQDMARHATAHCRTTRDTLLAADGAAAHEAAFDPVSNKLESRMATESGQASACLASDLAASLSGFTQVYGLTNAAEFLKVAERNAEYWLTTLPADRVPFARMGTSAPGQPKDNWKDVSSAALAASALLELAQQTKVPEHGVAYRSTALAMLGALTEPAYLGIDTPGWEGILRYEDYDAGEESIARGNFFFVKALAMSGQ